MHGRWRSLICLCCPGANWRNSFACLLVERAHACILGNWTSGYSVHSETVIHCTSIAATRCRGSGCSQDWMLLVLGLGSDTLSHPSSSFPPSRSHSQVNATFPALLLCSPVLERCIASPGGIAGFAARSMMRLISSLLAVVRRGTFACLNPSPAFYRLSPVIRSRRLKSYPL